MPSGYAFHLIRSDTGSEEFPSKQIRTFLRFPERLRKIVRCCRNCHPESPVRLFRIRLKIEGDADLHRHDNPDTIHLRKSRAYLYRKPNRTQDWEYPEGFRQSLFRRWLRKDQFNFSKFIPYLNERNGFCIIELTENEIRNRVGWQ